MAINVPMPEDAGSILASIPDAYNNARLNPYRMQLLQAQAREAQGSAAKSEMIANLLKQFGATNDQSGANGGQSQGSPELGKQLLYSLLGIHPQTFNTDGKVGYIDPATGQAVTSQVGETPEEKRAGEQRKAIETDQGKLDAKRRDVIKTSQRSMGTGIARIDHALGIMEKTPGLGGINNVITPYKQLNMPNSAEKTELDTTFGDILGSSIPTFSPRGTNLGIKTAQQYKPSLNNSDSANLGRLKGLLSEYESMYRENKKEWEQNHKGEDFPNESSLEDINKLKTRVDTLLKGNKRPSSLKDKMTASSAANSQSSNAGEPLIVMYKGSQEYRIPAKYAHSPKLKGFTLEPT